MQSRPDAHDLLDAVSDLLIKEILPRVQDDSLLAYKTLVSWNMLGVVSRELRQGEALLKEEARSLAAVLGEKPPGAMSLDSLRSYVREKNKALCSMIREKKIGPGNSTVLDHVKRVLAADLAVSNPRFSTATTEDKE